jgi:hypothetical protein
VAVRVLQHDDRVIDDDPDGQDQAQQRQRVDRVAQRAEDREARDDGNRDGQRRDRRRAERAQEEEDDEHHQERGQNQRLLRLADGALHEDRAVEGHVQLDARRQRLRDGRQLRVHALGDLETAHWASGLVGRSLQVFTGGSMTPSESQFDELMGRSRYTGNYSQSFELTLQANAFLHGLKTGGATNGLMCDAYVIRSGEPFASGENWLRASFSQRDDKQ